MPPDSDPTQPAQKPTVALPAVPPWAIELTKSVKDGFRDVQEHFDRQDATLATLTNNDLSASARMAKFELRLDGIEERQNRTSTGVRGISQNDMAQEAKLAEAIVKQQALESAIHETRAMVEPIADQIKKQSDLMGIGKAGVKWLASSEGRQTLLQIAAAVYAAIEVLKHGGIHL